MPTDKFTQKNVVGKNVRTLTLTIAEILVTPFFYFYSVTFCPLAFYPVTFYPLAFYPVTFSPDTKNFSRQVWDKNRVISLYLFLCLSFQELFLSHMFWNVGLLLQKLSKLSTICCMKSRGELLNVVISLETVKRTLHR